MIFHSKIEKKSTKFRLKNQSEKKSKKREKQWDFRPYRGAADGIRDGPLEEQAPSFTKGTCVLGSLV